MSFSSQHVVLCLNDQSKYYLLIEYEKTMALKQQQFKDSKSDISESKVSKRSSVDAYNNENKQSFN